ALREEIAREGRVLGRPRIRTLYVGGGTPSLLDPSEIELLAMALREALDVRPREATVEVNPATLDRERLDAWLALGIPRMDRGGPARRRRCRAVVPPGRRRPGTQRVPPLRDRELGQAAQALAAQPRLLA